MCNRILFTALCPAIALFAALNSFLCLCVHAAQTPSAAESAPPALSPEAQQKLSRLQTAARSARASHHAKVEAAALIQLADFDLVISEEKQALDADNHALALARSAKDPALEAAALIGIADCRRTESANDDALRTYQQAFDVAQAAGDIKRQAAALNGMGWVNDNTHDLQKGLDLHNQALALARQAGDPDLEALILNRIGADNDDLGDTSKALDLYHQALEKWRAANDIDGEAKALNNLGILAAESGDPATALADYTQALPLCRRAGDRAGEAGALNNMGVLDKNTGEEQKALGYFLQVLPLQRALANRRGEAAALNNLGNVYSQLGQNQQALNAFNQSLTIHQSLNNRVGQAGVLLNIGEQRVHLGEMQKALESLDQALALFAASGEPRGQANTLNAIGVAYDDLGQSQKALEYYERALAMYKDLNDPDGQATALNDIAGIYTAPDQKQHALEIHNQALQLERAAQNRDGEARTLNNMGLVYEDLGQKQKALESYRQALPIWHEVGNRDGEAQVLDNIGSLLSDSGKPDEARSYFAQALPLAAEVNDPLREAQIFHNMMLNEKVARPALAIFYGKQGVDLLQNVRGQIQGLDPALQKSFLATKTDYYRDLAALLIAQGRLPEAQQVLDLLKEQEYADYVRGETANTLQPLALTPTEQQAKVEYDESTTHMIALGEQWLALKNNSARTPDQEKTYQQLFDELDAASKGLNDYYARLYVALGSNIEGNRQLADVKGDVSRLKRVLQDSPHTVALYTLVGKDRYSVIVITGATAVAREFPIAEADLNAKVAAFQQVLRDPARDPKPLAAELYKILVGPAAADLDQAKAETLVWSLDGALRYIPMPALYDGSKYLVEKYSIATITPASIASLDTPPGMTNLSVAAMGISRQYENDLPALPAVAVELNDVVKDPQAKDAHGPLPGTILLNGDFTQQAMDRLLERDFSVVHIASHFVYRPGDDSQSYLLLAGKGTDNAGYHLTVADFRDDQRLSLENTDLLTLSACETGMSGAASNGREVDGLGTTAQLRGAKAVISSLWEVNDVSTGSLMADFYKRWADGAGKVTKAEALRQAQLDLLEGRLSPQPGTGGRGFGIVESTPAPQPGPAGYAHPYYWAPFVLMGNWK